MQACILACGTELSTGRIVDTNSAYLARELEQLGVEVILHVLVPDDLDRIVGGLTVAEQTGARFILMTGGLGPTEDDVTQAAVAQWAGVSQKRNEEALRQIEARFAAWGHPMSESNKRQADMPDGAIIISNDTGTAPGLLMNKSSTAVYCMPGVPLEMEHMWRHHISSMILEATGDTRVRESLSILIYGKAESRVGETLESITFPEGITIGTMAKPGGITVHLWIAHEDPTTAIERLEEAGQLVESAFGPSSVGRGNTSVPTRLLELLEAKGKSIAFASRFPCTNDEAGALASAIRETAETDMGLVAVDPGNGNIHLVFDDGETVTTRDIAFGSAGQRTFRIGGLSALDLARRILTD